MDLHCPICRRQQWAVEKANLILPKGMKIDTIDIYSGDPRAKIMADLFSSPNPDDWIVPAIIYDRPILQHRPLSFHRQSKESKRTMLLGYQGVNYLTYFFRRLLLNT